MNDSSDLNNEGVRLAGDGDLAGARSALEAALTASSPEDRAQVLVNLAHVVDMAGEREHAVDLLTEAVAVGEGTVRLTAIASRADLLPWLDRWEEAWRDVEAALVETDPSQQVVLRNTRVGLLMMAGYLAEAEAEAVEAVELAASHAPEYLANLYYNLALLADEAGDETRASMYRVLSDNPGRRPLGARWQRFVELTAEGAALLSSGDRPAAKAAFTAAYRETFAVVERETLAAAQPDPLALAERETFAVVQPEAPELSDPSGTIKTGVPLAGTPAQQPPAETAVDDVEVVVCRAGAAGNLAGVADDPEEAVRWSTEAVEAARTALTAVGDAYGSATVLVNALVSRAVARFTQTRLPDALADLDEALELVADAGESFEATVRATRARVLATGGWFAEAADEARTALDLAYTAAPAMAASVHFTLAEITSATGDLPGAAEHLALARDLSAATGDVAGEATALLSSARLSYLASDTDRADALYDEAEALLADDPRRRAACLHGRAAVAVLRGEPRAALALSDQALTLLDAASPLESLALHQVRGSAFEAAGDYAEAESCYAEAAALCEAAGLWHVALGMAWWRADALIRRVATATGNERQQLSRRALDLAMPAALASEAVRQRFPHGPLRERWVALASAPATRSAFLAIRAVGDLTLAAEYVDHIAGAVSLHAEGGTAPVERGDLVTLPAPPTADTHLPTADPHLPTADAHLPYAASGFATGADPAFPATGFELPPRVRLDPAVPTSLDAWIDVAEQRYGFPVRSERAVASW
ncbi:hypothetical protein ADK67_09055 [Saccharothrix sp. NRRL B-16348]|uniref:hypothetical protein n=1 Tax=Saccharothrix sp. NRRL B-16348 TaxID=1415542 RepID=UPI0006AE43E3|nr:hypothetical protein [Saccharothrix sp. NRRL B-16348]KOX31027.1 hypothetical protein ADK67_09055 [Saccharothrix sp. NRRL B-16348]